MNKKLLLLLIIILIGGLLLIGCDLLQAESPQDSDNGEVNDDDSQNGEGSDISQGDDQENGQDEEPEEPEVEEPEVEEFTTVTITAVGDVMVHQSQLDAQYNREEGRHDFRNNFVHLKPYLENSDLNLANLETTFAGTERGYSSFPLFNSPDALGEALKDAGFNVISTINNHTYDTGEQGFFRTLDVLEEQGLTPLGTRRDETEKRYVIKEVENIKVGMVGYTYETQMINGQITLNGITIPSHMEPLMNTFHDYHQDDAIEEMSVIIDDMRDKGAEIIVFFLHWGNEYHREPSAYQIQLAESLSALGVDIIFGSHPHVVQPLDLISHNGHETLVVYSMGNLISNQREETLRNHTGNAQFTEDGLMVHATFQKSSLTNEIERTSVEYTPLWVHRSSAGNGFHYEVLPVAETIGDFDAFNITGDALRNRIRRSLERTQEMVYKNLDSFELNSGHSE